MDAQKAEKTDETSTIIDGGVCRTTFQQTPGKTALFNDMFRQALVQDPLFADSLRGIMTSLAFQSQSERKT